MSCLVVAGCADEPEASLQPSDSASAVTVDSRMTDQPEDVWKTGILDDGARLEFYDGAYRMTATGWPLLSPSMDRRAAALDPVVVEAQVSVVAGAGLYGVACGITHSTAYVFVVGVQDSRPYYGIALLRDGVAQVLADPAVVSGTPPADTVVGGPGTTASVRATCSSGTDPGTGVLSMAVDGRPLLEVDSDQREPTGQAGLVALSRSSGELVVDVEGVVISSPG